MAVAREQRPENFTGGDRLLAAERVKRDILRSLETPFRIPRRLAVANVIDGRQGS